ncbi:MurF [Coprothermobacteraceae bacterium]|nr:MurF [Coprothermobacteraceae bacterium]
MLASALAKIVGGQLVGEDFSFERLCFNSNDCLEGSIFVALPGAKTHGIRFVEKAVERGAKGVLADRPVEGASYILVESASQAIIRLGHWLAQQYTGKVVVVLGASGKTTLKEVLRAIAPTSVWSSRGNRNTLISIITDLFNDFDRALRSPYWIIEFGIHERTDADDFLSVFSPYAAVFASLGAEHLEYLGSVEEAVSTNLKIGLVAQRKYALGQQDYVVEGATLYGSPDCSTYFKHGSFTSHGSTIGTLFVDGLEVDITLPFWGKRSTQAVAGAARFWLDEGFSLSELNWEGLQEVSVWGRQQLIRWNDFWIFFDAYNANPESMKEFLEVVKDVPYMHKGLVVGDMLELGDSSRYWHMELAHWLLDTGASYVVLIGHEVKVTLNEIRRLGGTAYVEWYRDTDTAKKFFEVPAYVELVGFKASRGVALEKLLENECSLEV